MATKWDAIRNEYETTNITLADLADKYGIKYPTIKSRNQRQGWCKDASKDASINKKDASEPNKDASKKSTGFQPGNKLAAGHGAPKGNQNAQGNKGGLGGPAGNKHAEKHGFFSRIFPDDEETMEILAEIQLKSPLDILWDQIQIQYLAIARAQKLMYVRDQQDMTKVLKRTKDSDTVEEREWELQHAWDKHATFLQAQSRAIKTLESLIAKYEELLIKDLGIEEKQLRIDKLKAEIAKITDGGGEQTEDDGFLDALQGSVKEVWADEEV